MKYPVRLLLVWLMLLTIPFQGIASAAMLACAHDARQMAPAAVQLDMHMPSHEAAARACHEPQAKTADLAPEGHDHDGRCSSCAACCMGAAIGPTQGIAPPPPLPNLTLLASASGRLAGVDLALPERPPRASLA